ncbi:hypothetical protein KY284_020264 [Solanum tuberosum]|nr:hypothetical protein KY284_020264 [Solanum tuberosum]
MNAISWKLYNDGGYMRGGNSEGYLISYSMLAGNKGWSKNNNEMWYERECENAIRVQLAKLHEPMNTHTDVLLTKIPDKVEGLDMILQEMKSNVSALSITVIVDNESHKEMGKAQAKEVEGESKTNVKEGGVKDSSTLPQIKIIPPFLKD